MLEYPEYTPLVRPRGCSTDPSQLHSGSKASSTGQFTGTVALSGKTKVARRKCMTSRIATFFVDKSCVLPSKMATDPFLVKYLADKHARQRRLTKERQKRHREKMINIGDQRTRWKEMMELLRIDNDRDMAQFLLDRWAQSCQKSGS